MFKSALRRISLLAAQIKSLVTNIILYNNDSGNIINTSDVITLTGNDSYINVHTDIVVTPISDNTKYAILSGGSIGTFMFEKSGLTSTTVNVFSDEVVKIIPKGENTSYGFYVMNVKSSDGNYSQNYNIDVNEGTVSSVELNVTSKTYSSGGGLFTLKATIVANTFTSAPILWSCNNTNCSISSTTGATITVTANSNASTTSNKTSIITCSCGGKTATCTITITKASSGSSGGGNTGGDNTGGDSGSDTSTVTPSPSVTVTVTVTPSPSVSPTPSPDISVASSLTINGSTITAGSSISIGYVDTYNIDGAADGYSITVTNGDGDIVYRQLTPIDIDVTQFPLPHTISLIKEPSGGVYHTWRVTT